MSGVGRHPPDRGPRLGRHRRQDRGHRGRDLRHPDRGRDLGVLLPLGRPVARERDRGRPGDQAPGPARGPRRPAATRAGPGRRRGRRTRSRVRRRRRPSASAAVAATGPRAPRARGPPPKASGEPRARRSADAGGQQPEMTRERARSERRDLDKERGEPVAGTARRPPLAQAPRAAARRLDEPAADPRHQRRRHRVPRHPRAQARARPDRRRDGRRAGHEPVRGRAPEDADAPAARPGADARRRVDSATRSTAPPPTASASRSSASSRSGSTSSRRASTTAPTWATTSRTRGRSPRRWRR